MKKLSVIISFVLGLAFVAPSALAAPPTKAPTKVPTKGLFKTQITGTLSVGQNGRVTLRILPGDGYKWNKEYPAKLELTDGDKVSFSKKQYKKVKGEIVADGKVGKVVIEGTGKVRGFATVDALMSFSICNAETCKVLRKRKLSLQITIK